MRGATINLISWANDISWSPSTTGSFESANFLVPESSRAGISCFDSVPACLRLSAFSGSNGMAWRWRYGEVCRRGSHGSGQLNRTLQYQGMSCLVMWFLRCKYELENDLCRFISLLASRAFHDAELSFRIRAGRKGWKNHQSHHSNAGQVDDLSPTRYLLHMLHRAFLTTLNIEFHHLAREFTNLNTCNWAYFPCPVPAT